MQSADFQFDPTKPSGAAFTFQDEHPMQFYKLNGAEVPALPPEFDQGEQVIVNDEISELHNNESAILAIP